MRCFLSLLQDCTVQTPQGRAYEGRRFHGKGVRMNIFCLFAVLTLLIGLPEFFYVGETGVDE